MTFEPRNLTRHPRFVRFEDDQGLQYEAFGGADRLALAFEVAQEIANIRKQSETLLCDFMKHKGTFSPEFAEIFALPEEDGGGVRIRYSFRADNDPHEFGYTYFDVIIAVREPPSPRFWPIKFVVGFW